MKTTSHKDAYQGSHYTICGAGGDLNEWVEGYNKLLAEEGIGTPTYWAQTTGENINNYAATHGTVTDPFPADLTVLTFPSKASTSANSPCSACAWKTAGSTTSSTT